MALLKDKAKRQELRRQLYRDLEGPGLDISETIKSLRKILAMDQQTFAEHVGVSLSSLRKLEQTTGGVQLRTVDKILSAFDLRLVVRTDQPSLPA